MRSMICGVASLLTLSLAACSSGGNPDGGTTSLFTAGGTGSSSGASGTTGTSGGTTSATTGSSPTGNGTGSPTSGNSGSASGSSNGSGPTGGSNGGSTGGPPGSWDSGCAFPDGGGMPGGPDTACMQNSDCACPLVCGTDPALSGTGCIQPCNSGADCPFTSQHCKQGQCLFNTCGEDGGVPVGAACDDLAPGSHDGICTITVIPGSGSIDLCVAAGGANTGCNSTPEIPRSSIQSQDCQSGYLCLDDGSGMGTGSCLQTCVADGGAGDTCASGAYACIELSYGFGLCVETSIYGCIANDPTPRTPGGACEKLSDCDCPSVCSWNPQLKGKFCEQQCSKTTGADGCPGADQICLDGGCAFNFCQVGPSGQTVPGAFGQPCDVLRTNDGTCTPEAFALADGGLGWAGLCYPVGTSAPTGSCDPNALRDAGSDSLCTAGGYCEFDNNTMAITCETPCTWISLAQSLDGGVADGGDGGASDGGDGGNGSGCGTGLGCFQLTGSAGACGTCTPSATSSMTFSCQSNGECCSGICAHVGAAQFCQ